MTSEIFIDLFIISQWKRFNVESWLNQIYLVQTNYHWTYWWAWRPWVAKVVLRLTHWGRVMHIWVGNLTIIASDNGLSPGRCHAIIWTNAGILLIGPWGEISIGIQAFSFKKMLHLKMSSAKWRPFCLGLNVLRHTLARCDNSCMPLFQGQFSCTIVEVMMWMISYTEKCGCY